MQSGRAGLQPLLLGYAAEATERDGHLQLFLRDGRVDHVLDANELAVGEDTDGFAELTRLGAAECSGTLRLSYVDVQGDFVTRAAEARHPDEDLRAVAATELALGLTAAEARAVTYRWLAEDRIGRDSIRFSLPPSRLDIGAGDTVALQGPAGGSTGSSRAMSVR
ncbi:hypothetical protein MASR1M32_29340 [Rhodobacter sp.]